MSAGPADPPREPAAPQHVDEEEFRRRPRLVSAPGANTGGP